MKSEILLVCFLAIACVPNLLIAQPQRSPQILSVPPDEYTDILLGERELPEGVAILSLERPERGKNKPLMQRSIPSDAYTQSASVIELSPDDAQSQASMLVFRKFSADAESLGRHNLARLLAASTGTSEAESLGIVDFIKLVNEEADQFSGNLKYQNCELFKNDIAEIGSPQAVSNLIDAERMIGRKLNDYYADIISTIDTSIGTSPAEFFRDQISSVAANTTSFRFDYIKYFQLTGENPELYYLAKCANLSE